MALVKDVKKVLGWLTDRVEKLPLPAIVKSILKAGRKAELWDVKNPPPGRR